MNMDKFFHRYAASNLVVQFTSTMDIPVILTPLSGDVDPPTRIMVQRT